MGQPVQPNQKDNMPTAGEFLNALALKAGLKPDNELLKNVLSAPDLAKISVPDELVTQIDAGLLNIEAAKNNHPAIKSKYFAEAYDGMDAEILKLPVDAEVLDILKQEKSTTKKLALLVEKLKAAKPADAGEVTPLKQKINELQQQLAQLAETKSALEQQHQKDILNMKRDITLESELSSYKTIYDELDPAIKKMTLKSILDKNLQDSNAVFTLDDNGSLVLLGKDGTNVFGSDHRQLTPKAFLDKSFASILKVSEPAKNPNPPKPVPGKAPVQGEGNSHVSLHNAQALADFENAGKAKMF